MCFHNKKERKTNRKERYRERNERSRVERVEKCGQQRRRENLNANSVRKKEDTSNKETQESLWTGVVWSTTQHKRREISRQPGYSPYISFPLSSITVTSSYP
jgi:hypothetical protein